MDMPTKTIRVLIIEDSGDDALLLIRELENAGFGLESKRVETELSLRFALKDPWDIIFCDYTMPALNGLQALNIVRELNEDVPFIFVSGTIGEDVAVEAMRTGAQDYILKDSLKRLVPAVERELKESEHRRRRREAEERLNFLAHYDELTGLPNRSYFLQVLEKAIEEATMLRRPLALVYLDLDRFKAANDSLGYEAGDQLLIQVAERLQRCVSSKATVARFAGDEFAILFRNLGDHVSVSTALEKIQKSIAEPFNLHGCMLYLDASIGIAAYPADAIDANHLMRSADLATCRVKRDGGKHFRFYSADMEVNFDERLALDHAMRQALPNGEFILHFQPQIEIATGETTAVEALVRWDRGRKGMVPPNDFIPLAEETGFILPLGEWVLRNACRQTAEWRAQGFKDLRIAVNLSARQLYQSNLIPLVSGILDDCGLETGCLELEITETAIIQDSKLALSSLTRLSELGVKVALDDFGTGYSSLSHLKDFMVDTLKIDRSFISGIPSDANTTAITAGVIAMAAKLGIRVVAEGVETLEQYRYLQDQGCEYVQGYFLGKPVPAKEVVLTA